MKKLIYAVTLISLNSIAMSYQDKYQEFTNAIINNEQDKAESMLEKSIEPNVCLNHQGKLMLCIKLALINKNTEMAQLLTKVLTAKINTQKIGSIWERPFISAFQDASKEQNIELIDQLMLLPIPDRIKKIGCRVAYTSSIHDKHVSVIKKLFDDYGDYIENPCFDATFQWAAICFRENYTEVLDIVLSNYIGLSNFKHLIESNHLNYPDRKQKYIDLLNHYEEKTAQLSMDAFDIITSSKLSEKEKIEELKILIAKRYDLNFNIFSGFTILHFAALRHNRKVAKFLIENGANPHIKNCDFNTPYDLANGDDLGAAGSDDALMKILISSKCKFFRPGLKCDNESEQLKSWQQYNKRYNLNLELGPIFK